MPSAVRRAKSGTRSPRLSQRISMQFTITLIFSVEEVLNFTQVDLVPEDVMLLDTGETLFVWLGYESSKSERTEVLVTAKDYLLSDPSERNTDIPVIVVKQSFEPPNFTGFFGAWDPDLLPMPDVAVC